MQGEETKWKVFKLVWCCDEFKQMTNDVFVNVKIRCNFWLSRKYKFPIPLIILIYTDMELLNNEIQRLKIGSSRVSSNSNFAWKTDKNKTGHIYNYCRFFRIIIYLLPFRKYQNLSKGILFLVSSHFMEYWNVFLMRRHSWQAFNMHSVKTWTYERQVVRKLVILYFSFIKF